MTSTSSLWMRSDTAPAVATLSQSVGCNLSTFVSRIPKFFSDSWKQKYMAVGKTLVLPLFFYQDVVHGQCSGCPQDLVEHDHLSSVWSGRVFENQVGLLRSEVQLEA